ncbi:deleted in malignant brain tumors 1 protein-like isoform X2 [Pomacea canaliculata]|uniref:deleted in malignant brain tumors 1 protein-like isoform X2 n=1 Tax=Pomacea canaliculata TaxID=400727 RepID=UPI000D733127|nr:deleted in malignant brain tumors 1 protein-like isoform X2 [Pomacea canaliculata]
MCRRTLGQTGNCQRPARVLCSSTSAPEVRLAGGGSSYGRVEILMDGQTYSVCDNGWNASAATVVCRLLGYQSGQPARRSYYGAGTGQVALDRVACRTSDTSLLACRSSGWLETEAACGDHSKDAGVICFDKVQLIGGDHSTGILLVNIDMTTYVLCDLGLAHYTISTACWELGFEHGYALRSGAFGLYDASYPLRTIDCLRGMRTISSCLDFPIVCNSASRFNYASIYCFNGSRSSDFSVSLHASQGLLGNSSGRLVVSQGGVRGRVCPDNWDDVDAGVVCRQLGYRGGVAQAVWDAGTGPYLLVNVACTGVETSIFSCQSSGVCFHSYENPLDVGVACFNDTLIAVQLVGGTSNKEGLVQVVYGSQVGTVCVPDTYNRDNAARVVCIQVGYKDGKFRTFPRGTGTVSMSEVICDGYERSVFMCRSRGLFVPPSDRCANHDFDLGVRCSDGVRLAYSIDNTNNSITGVVQINRGSGWIDICNDFFDDLDAQVVCRSQGYPYSRVLPRGSMYGYNFYVTALNCNGTEASLLDCPEQQNITCPFGNGDIYATVFCSETPVERGLQAAPMAVGGHVVVMADGVKSYVCRDNWDDAAASVYCKDLGYNNGVAIYQITVFISRGVAAYFVNSIHCTGNETSLSECSFSSNWSTCVTSYQGAAQALCYNYTRGRQLRLTGGTISRAGQVEVGFNGVWGTVCDNDFTNYDATAVCLTLGYFGGVTTDNSSISSRDQSQTGPFYLYGLSCSGSETSLWQCPVSNFSVSSNICSSPSYIPRVRCMGQSEVKLVENAGYGAVQVPINTTSRTYGLVCDDNFTDREASVACRDLGYPYGIHLCCSAFGYKSLPIVRSGVRCTGTEALFSDCYYDTRTYCLSGKYASIVCSNIPPGRGYTVQIDTVSRGSYGRVKVQHMDYWGFVCPNGFDHNDANVICREAGYTGGWAVVDKSYYDSSSLRWLSNIDCDGSESHLTRCRNLVFGNVSDCGNTGIAAVYCNREADTQFRLVNGTQTTGRVEVSIDYGNSGSICSAGWTDVEAAVACKSMGFRSGRFLGAGIYGQGSSYLLFTRVDCTRVASSQSLLDCDLSLRDLDNLRTPCLNSTSGPAVQCFEHPVRLTGTRQENYGRVEVYVNNNWTAVCDQGFDQTAAQVACRALGLLYARPQCCSALGPLGTGPVDARQIGFKVNRCRGDEATLVDCDVSPSVVCPSGKYASLLCSNTSLQEQTLTVRLAGPGGYYGMVEVNRYGLWGPVCNRNWDDRDANATCRGLGYSHGVTFFGNNITETPILVGDFQCSGQETSLAGCSFKDSSDDIGCSERRVVAGVLCSRNGDPQGERRVGRPKHT